MRAASFLPLFIGYPGHSTSQGGVRLRGNLQKSGGQGEVMLHGVINQEASRSLRETAGYPHEG